MTVVRRKVEAHHQEQQGSRGSWEPGVPHTDAEMEGARHTVGWIKHPFSWEALPDAPSTPNQGRYWPGKH